MFKKLVVGALATGIVLTGGIGAASASTENLTSATLADECSAYPYIKFIGDGNKYARDDIKYSDGKYANSFTEKVCGGTMYWYFKTTNRDGSAHYEGRLVK
ncbi:hypothetical protein COK07_24260 [Bacillus thuringiensis]|uniref:hypothetical protein n=1 Tax=Bacillus thuringiensis TaxID=1428 RepID=UPI000BF73D73|nr:hypothetical protein [Bacillus thuringiensis]PFI27344.1 hypothetical protein COI53_24710 [Bacillus thuringiensis]PFP73388.1 hypothetical protein COK07_24260 [Bacillus thuringiensis]